MHPNTHTLSISLSFLHNLHFSISNPHTISLFLKHTFPFSLSNSLEQILWDLFTQTNLLCVSSSNPHTQSLSLYVTVFLYPSTYVSLYLKHTNMQQSYSRSLTLSIVVDFLTSACLTLLRLKGQTVSRVIPTSAQKTFQTKQS